MTRIKNVARRHLLSLQIIYNRLSRAIHSSLFDRSGQSNPFHRKNIGKITICCAFCQEYEIIRPLQLCLRRVKFNNVDA